MEIVIITGLSGAGKTKTSDWFEDHEYYCIDNMPISLIKNFIDLTILGKKEIKKAAFVVDSRGNDFLDELDSAIKYLKADKDIKLDILYIDCSTEVLIRRYSETRREHPLSKGKLSLEEAIELEKKMLQRLKKSATFVIDTSTLKTSEFNSELEKLFITKSRKDSFHIKFESFGYKKGIPLEADWVIDTRFIPNPYYIEELKELNGMNDEVYNYVLKQSITKKFLKDIVPLIESLIKGYKKEGKYSLTVAVGCTGGQHRSVSVARELNRIFSEKGHTATLENRDI